MPTTMLFRSDPIHLFVYNVLQERGKYQRQQRRRNMLEKSLNRATVLWGRAGTCASVADGTRAVGPSRIGLCLRAVVVRQRGAEGRREGEREGESERVKSPQHFDLAPPPRIGVSSSTSLSLLFYQDMVQLM